MADQQLCGLLVATNLLQSDRTWAVAANLLHHFRGCALPSDVAVQLRDLLAALRLGIFGFGVEDLVDSGDLSPGRFPCCLLCTHHLDRLKQNISRISVKNLKKARCFHEKLL